MGAGIWNKIKNFFKDFGKGFKYGWNKTRNFLAKVPIIGKIAEKLPTFKNTPDNWNDLVNGRNPKPSITFKNGKAVLK